MVYGEKMKALLPSGSLSKAGGDRLVIGYFFQEVEDIFCFLSHR